MKSPHYQRGHIEVDDYAKPKKNLLPWIFGLSILGMLLVAIPASLYAQKWIVNNLMVEPKVVKTTVDNELMERLYFKCLESHKDRITPFAAQCSDAAMKMATRKE